MFIKKCVPDLLGWTHELTGSVLSTQIHIKNTSDQNNHKETNLDQIALVFLIGL